MKKLVSLLLSMLICISATAQPLRYSEAMIKSHGYDWSAGESWDYVSGLVTKSILMYCDQYPEEEASEEFYQWCKTYTDNSIDANGNFYKFGKGSLDNIASGKVFFNLYNHELATGNNTDAERYRKAAEFLYKYLRDEYIRIKLEEGKGGFIHKDSYPDQMWLDGLYMGSAFYAEYLDTFVTDEVEAWDGWMDIALQFKTIHKHTYNPEIGLNYHGWSANPSDANSFWAKKDGDFKGCSQEFWGRGMGWYAAALADVLGMMPEEHPDYKAVAEIFDDVANGILKWQDEKSGVWYQLLQYNGSFKSSEGTSNYLEASASSMFTYALLKGLRLGLLDYADFEEAAQKAYDGLTATFITENNAGGIDINNICSSAGLGPSHDKGRDGTADYYLDGRDVGIVSNEGKGIGSFIMASLEHENYSKPTTSALSTVKTDSTPTMIFDLQGRQCQTAPKGLYIELRDGVATKKINK